MRTPVEDPGVEICVESSVLHIELNRPKQKNALHGVAVEAIVDALEGASTEDSLRAVRISGRGGNFCSGADWVAPSSDRTERSRTVRTKPRTR